MKTKIEVFRTVIGTGNITNPRYMIAIHEGRGTWYIKSYNTKTHNYVLTGDKLYGHPWSMATVKNIMKEEGVKRYSVIE